MNKDYILFKFENWKHDKEIHKEDGFYTIEHIMPQKQDLFEEWQLELGDNWREIHKKYHKNHKKPFNYENKNIPENLDPRRKEIFDWLYELYGVM